MPNIKGVYSSYSLLGWVTLKASVIFLALWGLLPASAIESIGRYFFIPNPVFLVVLAICSICVLLHEQSRQDKRILAFVILLCCVGVGISAVRLWDVLQGNPLNSDLLIFSQKLQAIDSSGFRFTRANSLGFMVAFFSLLSLYLHHIKFFSYARQLSNFIHMAISVFGIVFAFLRNTFNILPPLFLNMRLGSALIFLILGLSIVFLSLRAKNQMIILTRWKFIGICMALFIPFWYLYIVPQTSRLDWNFSYIASLNSRDSFYDDSTKTFSDTVFSTSTYSLKAQELIDNTLNINGEFTVIKPNNEVLFSVKREYSVDQVSGSHVITKNGTKRDGYLFAPRNNLKNPFTYWHLNYDTPITMNYQTSESLLGLPVEKYRAVFTVDQTKELSHLANVGETLGVNLDVELLLWIEPSTGYLIKYQDNTIGYYYDLTTNQRVKPWNSFSNTFTESAIQENVAFIQNRLFAQLIIQFIIPLILITIIMLYLLVFLLWEKYSIHPLTYAHYYIIFFGLVISLLGYYALDLQREQKLFSKFEQDTTQIIETVTTRLKTYNVFLNAGAANFISQEELLKDEWNRFVERFGVFQEFPGLQGIGFAQVVPGAYLEEFIQKARESLSEDFSVKPPGAREKYSIILFLEPLTERNQQAIGFDMYQEQIRRIAMDRALDEKQSVISGKVTLVQEIDQDVQQGFLLYNPVVKNSPTATVSAFVYSPFRARDFIEGISSGFNDYVPFSIELETHEFSNSFEEIYSSLQRNTNQTESKIKKTVDVPLFHNRIRFHFVEPDTFILPGFDNYLPETVFVSSFALTCLISLTTYSLASSRKKALEMLDQETKELQKFKLAVENASDQIVITDATGLVIYANPTLKRITGYEIAEALGTKAGKLWGGLMSRSFYSEMWDTIKNKKKDFSGEIKNKRKNGEHYFASVSISPILDSNNNVEFFVALERDITKEKLEEQRLKEQKRKDDAILTSIGDGLVVTDQFGTVIVANDGFEEILGWKPQEILGKKMVDIVKMLDANGKIIAPENRPFIKVLKSKKAINDSEGIFVRKDGKNIPVSITITPIVLDNQLSGVIEVFRDISVYKEVDRMKTEFISLASHQLRTPLSAVKWFVELLKDSSKSFTTDQSEIISKIDESNERMIELVNALLNVSRIESGRIIIEPTPTKIQDLIAQSIQEIEPKIREKKQKIITDIKNDLPEIMLDQNLARQIIINLLSNASKYSPDSSLVTISLATTDSHLQLSVTDQGFGIPAEEQNKVFEKFFRAQNITQKETDGNGLGLYLVKAIVEASEGTISFTSVENKGTTFTVSLPLKGCEPKKGEVHFGN